MYLGTASRIQATARQRDPNDGVTVVWAPVSLHHYHTRHHTHHHIPSPRRIGNERMTKLGMSNGRGSRRVSSPGVFFFVYLIVLIINSISSFQYTKYKQTTTKTGPKNLKRRYKQSFGVSMSFFLYCNVFLTY